MTNIVVSDRTTQEKLNRLADLLEQAGALARELGQVIHSPSLLRQRDPALHATEADVDAAIGRNEYSDFSDVEGLLTDLHATV